jgi:hypothetical protein
MNIESILKLISALAIFSVLGWFEAPITNPPPTQEVLDYQKYYKEQSVKPYLSEQEFEELTKRADEMINNKNTNVSSLLLLKFLFALLLALSAFVVSKYLLSSLNKWSGAFTILVCFLSIVWFASSFELVVYMVFCAFGALLAQKFNNVICPRRNRGE